MSYLNKISEDEKKRYYVEIDHPVENAGTGTHIVLYIYAYNIAEIKNMFREYTCILVECTE